MRDSSTEYVLFADMIMMLFFYYKRNARLCDWPIMIRLVIFYFHKFGMTNVRYASFKSVLYFCLT